MNNVKNKKFYKSTCLDNEKNKKFYKSTGFNI